MEGIREKILKRNKTLLMLFLTAGVLNLTAVKSHFLTGFVTGGVFFGINLYLLIIGVTMFFYPGARKTTAYVILIAKSLMLYGGLALILIKVKTDVPGFLSGFGIYMLSIMLTGFLLPRTTFD